MYWFFKSTLIGVGKRLISSKHTVCSFTPLEGFNRLCCRSCGMPQAWDYFIVHSYVPIGPPCSCSHPQLSLYADDTKLYLSCSPINCFMKVSSFHNCPHDFGRDLRTVCSTKKTEILMIGNDWWKLQISQLLHIIDYDFKKQIDK